MEVLKQRMELYLDNSELLFTRPQNMPEEA